VYCSVEFARAPLTVNFFRDSLLSPFYFVRNIQFIFTVSQSVSIVFLWQLSDWIASCYIISWPTSSSYHSLTTLYCVISAHNLTPVKHNDWNVPRVCLSHARASQNTPSNGRILIWLGVITVRTLDSWSKGRGFKSWSGRVAIKWLLLGWVTVYGQVNHLGI